MTVAVAVAVGVLVGAAVLLATHHLLSQPVFSRTNHRGRPVPTAGGLVVVIAALGVEAAWSLAEVGGLLDPGATVARRAVLLAVVGFGMLGLVDDLAGSGEDGRGFRGHLRALARGRLTTGGLKLLGGAAIAIVVCAPRADGRLGRLLVDAMLVALAANLGNLFDRAPGRTTKVGLAAGLVVVAAAGAPTSLAGTAVVLGAALATLPADLRERLMLGDTGANALGGALGLGVVLAFAPPVRLGALIAVVVLNVASEAVSFSRVIDTVPPLRWLDRLGRAA
ncbi:MAG TPA: hypothetical protein VMN58_01435 [Acidimicrobiales bacterium]|nr:hypothetical protein [Acidimicrobiales bacterium]